MDKGDILRPKAILVIAGPHSFSMVGDEAPVLFRALLAVAPRALAIDHRGSVLRLPPGAAGSGDLIEEAGKDFRLRLIRDVATLFILLAFSGLCVAITVVAMMNDTGRIGAKFGALGLVGACVSAMVAWKVVRTLIARSRAMAAVRALAPLHPPTAPGAR